MRDDFDIESLAKYLHLSPAQVMKMADRGRVPGRRISGQWRFSQAEIHHWLEERIGASADEELEQVEKVLRRGQVHEHEQEEELALAPMIPAGGINLSLRSHSRRSVINEIVNVAAHTGMLWDAEKMIQAVLERENLHPTALDIGVALLHPRRPLSSILAEPCLFLGKTGRGIPFGGSKGRLTDLFFLICSTDDRVHLRVLARLSRLLGDPSLLEGLRHSQDEQEARQWIADKEEELLP